MSAPPELSETNRKRLQDLLFTEFTDYLNTVDAEHIPVYERDDGNYDTLKYTVLPQGTRLRFRSRQQLHWLDPKPIWADYSQLLGKPSFLNEEKDYAMGMQYYFGSWVNTIELRKDMTILHMPINYERIIAPRLNRTNKRRNNATRRIRRNINITSDFEAMVRMLCVPSWRARTSPYKEKLNKYNIGLCRDGYTMDFFYKLAGTRGKGFEGMKNRLLTKMEGFREICLTNVTRKTVKLIDSVYAPVEA